jgi:S-adenosylmethionine:tRNA ribosyltransferase-isomerase
VKLNLEDFDYHLPEELIAQRPAERREDSRLLVLDRASGEIYHSFFAELKRWLAPESLITLNDAKVVPARLIGRKETGGRIEVVLLDVPAGHAGPGNYEIECLARPAKRLRVGTKIIFGPGLTGQVHRITRSGSVFFNFCFSRPPLAVLEALGRMPLPPYIKRADNECPGEALDRERYQTVYAMAPGAVAAPTAGLHFTQELLAGLRAEGHDITSLTLLVGHGTFAPVRERNITRHRIHAERMILSEVTAEKVNRAKSGGRPITTVGTTGVRSLEFTALQGFPLQAYEGWCDLFIYPGFEFKIVDHLITNFHLPRSSLLMLVAAFAGLEKVLSAYREAVAEKYRFYSYGDAMLIL